ncbi:hypothetical protein JOF28_001223 [Leucobacter exalbidus]|uniref:SRPBCC domain-containing protein n=1 Tax=Leucobacter exalbidus TaxID=662960 RepID=A0A940PXI5_9MICO|nr:SRPBCC domain-containing protein [Leucobacter exalbidus]MBP1325991.1 hypothetical protein [Leucobacter exalbidus]
MAPAAQVLGSSAPVATYDPSTLVVSDVFEIAAPASVVWDVLMDLARYGEWNPFCVWAESTFEIGAPLHMRLVNYTNPGSLQAGTEYICAVEPHRLLSWELPFHEAWPYAARRDQILEEVGPELTRYQSTDAFLGENAIHVMRFSGEWVTRAFNDTGRALKLRAEALHRGDIS